MTKLKLTMSIRESFRLWSMRLNVLASLAVTYVLASPEVLLSTLNSLPPEMRMYFPPVIGFALFAIVAIVRLVKQEKLNKAKPDGK